MSKAVLYDELGGPEVLYVAEVETPELKAHQVLVRVEVAGLNPYDAKVRSGDIPTKATFPRRIGSDFAGVVEEVGEDATYWDGTTVAVGDRVMGRAAGSVAERAVASAKSITLKPGELPVEVAGSLDVAGLTAMACLINVPVGEGDTLLVGGATGAVGLILSQLAVSRGAKVLGTGSARNAEYLESIGVTPVTYGPGLQARVEEIGPLTAVIDCHGREALDVGIALGVPPERMAATAAFDALEELGIKPVGYESRTAHNLAILAERAAEGDVSVPVVASFDLPDAVEAFKLLESPHAPGKVIVTP